MGARRDDREKIDSCDDNTKRNAERHRDALLRRIAVNVKSDQTPEAKEIKECEADCSHLIDGDDPVNGSVYLSVLIRKALGQIGFRFSLRRVIFRFDACARAAEVNSDRSKPHHERNDAVILGMFAS